MAVIKCKMCGGELDISGGLSVCECEYCGTKQTVPAADDEKKLTLFARANRLRLANEFDKAAGVYESIVADFPEEAEAYWGLVLCRYGVEYVDDPATGRKVPTCHRSSFESVMEEHRSNIPKGMVSHRRALYGRNDRDGKYTASVRSKRVAGKIAFST